MFAAAVSEVSSPNGVSPLLLYCAASLSAAESARQPLDATITVQCGRVALHEDRLDLLTGWITQNDRCSAVILLSKFPLKHCCSKDWEKI